MVNVIYTNSYKKADNKEIVAFIDEIKGDREDSDIAWSAFKASDAEYSKEDLKEFAILPATF